MEEGVVRQIIDSKSKTFSVFCFCFLFGVASVSWIDHRVDLFYFISFLFLVVIFLIIFWSDVIKRFFLFSIFLFVLGMIRFLIVFPPDLPFDVFSKVGESVVLNGHISAEPDVRIDGVRYLVELEGISGKVYIKLGLYPRYMYGERIRVWCDLGVVESIEDESGNIFRYDMYLARYGVFVLCKSPEVIRLDGGESGGLLWIFRLKSLVAGQVNKIWHEPYASFMAGLLYGYRGGLGELNELFNRTGVTHIVAISGYNISIVAGVLIGICKQIGVGRKESFWLLVSGISLFVIFAGASASVVRAGVMGIFVLLAKQAGRVSRVANIMLFSAVLMCLHNPLVLFWDAGFQLSFMAALGLVYLSPILIKWFLWLPKILQESAASTISAIIFTLPLVLFHFSRLSLVAPFVNVMILWIVPFIMLVGFLSVVLSFVFFPLGMVVSWIAWLGMYYIVSIVRLFGSFSFASVELGMSLWVVLFCYFFIFILVRSYGKVD